MDLLIFAGTRPEIIKLAPIWTAAQRAGLSASWVATGQHSTLADSAYEAFSLSPSRSLDLDWDRCSLPSLSGALQCAASKLVAELKPRFVLVQGDTATAYAGAFAGFINQVPVGHVEAGLRTQSIASPFPEEGFRRLIARISDLHFSPTKLATGNLRREGVARSAILETGNTVIDAVLHAAPRARRPEALPELPRNAKLVLLTAHRRENWDGKMDGICEAVLTLRDKHPRAHFVLPVHANPRVGERIRETLGGEDRVHLLPSLPYLEFVWLMKEAYLILSDSGGVQEEAVSLGAPVLVMRDSTERMEAVKAGAAKLVGGDPQRIVRAASPILANPLRRRLMSGKRNPFGDGRASERVVSALQTALGG